MAASIGSPSRPRSSPILIGAGRFARPADAFALLGLPILRPLSVAASLEPMALPVLFARLLGRESVRGVLTLAHGGTGLSVPVLAGRACICRAEQEAVAQAFVWPEGTYDFQPRDVPAGREPPTSMMRLTVEGLRVLGCTFSSDDMEQALGGRLDQAPILRPGTGPLVKRFGLAAGELRLVESSCDGATSGQELLHSALGRHTTLELLLLLTLFDALVWLAPRAQAKTAAPGQRKITMDGLFSAVPVSPKPKPPSGGGA